MREPLALQRRVFAVPERVFALEFSPDGASLAVATHGPLVVIDLEGGAVRSRRGSCHMLVWTASGLLALSHTRVMVVGKRARRGTGAVVAALAGRDETRLYDDVGGAAGALPGSWGAAVRGGVAATVGSDELTVYEAATRRVLARHAIDGHHIALAPDGARVLVAGQTGAWEGPIAGPLTWYPDTGVVAHSGGHFAIGRAVYRVGAGEPLRLQVHDVVALAFAPDGSTLAIGSHCSVVLVTLAALAAWHAPIGPEDTIVNLAADPPRGRIAAVDRSGVVCVWQAVDRRLLAALRVEAGEHALAFAGDGALLVGTLGIEVWDVEAGVRRAAIPILGLRRVEQIVVAGDMIAVRDHDRVALLAPDLTVRRMLWAGEEDRARVVGIALTPDGRLLGVARDGRPALLVDTNAGSVRRELAEAQAIVLGERLLAHSTYGAGTLTTIEGGEDEQIVPFSGALALGDAILWRNNNRVGVRAPRDARLDVQYGNSVYAIGSGAAPGRYMTAGDRWLGERALVDGTLRRVFAAGACGKVTALAFDPAGERLAVGEYDGRVHVWQLGAAPRRLGLLDGTALQAEGTIRQPGRVGEISALAFTERELVACAGEVLVWDAADLTNMGSAALRVVDVQATRIANDGSRLFVGGEWNEYVVYDAAGAELSRGPGIDARERYIDLSDDGRRVLLGSAQATTSELTVQRDTGELLGTLRVDDSVQCARFDAQGRVIGAALRGPLFRWDPIAARVDRWIAAPAVDRDSLEIVARCPGRVVLAHGGGLTLIDADSGAVLAAIAAHGLHGQTCVALSRDGRRVAVGDWNGQVRVYEVGDRADRARCVAAVSGTTEGGWWVYGVDGFDNGRGDAVSRDWGGE